MFSSSPRHPTAVQRSGKGLDHAQIKGWRHAKGEAEQEAGEHHSKRLQRVRKETSKGQSSRNDLWATFRVEQSQAVVEYFDRTMVGALVLNVLFAGELAFPSQDRELQKAQCEVNERRVETCA